MIKVNNLTKIINGQVILRDISMELKCGKIYGFVGRNGSGKTMLMRHLIGFTYATEGEVIVKDEVLGAGRDVPENVGAIIETPGFIPEFSGYKNLKILASIRGKITNDAIKDAMILVGLNPDEKKAVRKYSLGMKQRLGLAQALMEKPDILILDEPMNGLDNSGVNDMRDLLLKRRSEDNLIVIASHNSEDIRILCDELFYFDEGKIVKHEVLSE